MACFFLFTTLCSVPSGEPGIYISGAQLKCVEQIVECIISLPDHPFLFPFFSLQESVSHGLNNAPTKTQVLLELQTVTSFREKKKAFANVIKDLKMNPSWVWDGS